MSVFGGSYLSCVKTYYFCQKYMVTSVCTAKMMSFFQKGSHFTQWTCPTYHLHSVYDSSSRVYKLVFLVGKFKCTQHCIGIFKATSLGPTTLIYSLVPLFIYWLTDWK